MSVHVIIGSDDYLVSETAKKIVGDGVGLETVDSAASTNADLQLRDLAEADASFSTPPFLDPRKVTWWKNVHFLPGGGRRGGGEGGRDAAQDVKAALERFAAKLVASPLPENQEFILSGPHLLKTSLVCKTLAKGAELVVFESGKPWEAAKAAVRRVADFAAGAGLHFAPGAADRLVATVGADTRSLMNEMAKLRDYLEPGATEIREADVTAIACAGVGAEPEFWAVTDALGARDVARLLAALAPFEGESGFEVMISTVAEKFFRQMLDVAADRTAALAPFAVRKMSGFLRNWTVRELRVARARFMRLRERVVSGTDCGRELAVIELVRVARRAGR